MSVPRSDRTALGRSAEALAAGWLADRGWLVLARNWRRGPGELDLVASRDSELAFVEVKRVDAWGLASLSDSVGGGKRRRLVETSKLFLLSHREFECMKVRYDVIAVRGGRVAAYLEHAFSERT